MKVIVFGAGAWGTALAVHAAREHQVTLWARDVAQAAQMAQAHENARYLPGIALPTALRVHGGALPELAASANTTDLLIAAMPMAGLRATLTALHAARPPVAWLCKGFEQAQPAAANTAAAAAAFGLLPHEVQNQVARPLRAGVLSGPSFAQEVARGQPAALVAASGHATVRDALVTAFHGGNLRVYANDDIIGVEVGGAVKNVLAIAAGLADGMRLGLNARAALITRGLAEMTRLGLALGARAETFMGLSGVGDLVLTATGDLSRNRQIGLQLAAGKMLAHAVQSLGHVAEGVYSARTVLQRARHVGVEMPVTECVVAVLDGQITPADALTALMEREPKTELR
ncbi:MAG: NAD(P)-dependent glycerol-3-phosphate dehydrogenase [Burkholderiaceae bacterium]|nr:NAD(P)-dependent glycerol-3-phosphate dehydrogenase [Burkholderiaceae bacterium]